VFPKLIEIGPFFIPSYGFFVALGVFVSLLVAKLRARKEGMDGVKVFDTGLSIVIASFIGSKIALVFVYPGDFFRSFSSFISLIRSGGVFYGGFIAGVITAILLIRKARFPIWTLGDVYGAALPIGQAIGRIGCFMAGCCWGKSCSLPWAVTFTNPFAHEITGVPLHTSLHPSQLYLSLSDLTIFFLLQLLYTRRRFKGQIFLMYAWLYGAARFLLEFLRGDPRGTPLGGPLSTSQVVAIVVVTVSSFFLLRGYLSSRGSEA